MYCKLKWTVLYFTVHSSALYCTVLYCNLQCTVLYCTVMYSAVDYTHLYCTVQWLIHTCITQCSGWNTPVFHSAVSYKHLYGLYTPVMHSAVARFEMYLSLFCVSSNLLDCSLRHQTLMSHDSSLNVKSCLKLKSTKWTIKNLRRVN